MAKPLAGFVLFSGLLAILAACGGSALIDGQAHGSAGAGAAGFSSGGAGPGPGGAGSSAVGAGGGAQSVAGAPADGGAPGDACSAAMVAGQCRGHQPSFWHNPKSGLCEPFIYGGCGGNANRYATRDACSKACPGGGSDWGACKVDSDCKLTSAGCCDACEPVENIDWIALNGSYLSEQMATRPCANAPPCVPCAATSEEFGTGKYFRAVCTAGQCSTRDLRHSAETDCSDGDGCMFRDGVNCCPECDGANFVAVSVHATFCPNGQESCGKCTPVEPPTDLVPVCDGNRCMIEPLLK